MTKESIMGFLIPRIGDLGLVQREGICMDNLYGSIEYGIFSVVVPHCALEQGIE